MLAAELERTEPLPDVVPYKDLLKLIPYKRIGKADGIGCVAAWLASDQADYIYGASIFVDGGMTLYPGFGAGG